MSPCVMARIICSASSLSSTLASAEMPICIERISSMMPRDSASVRAAYLAWCSFSSFLMGDGVGT